MERRHQCQEQPRRAVASHMVYSRWHENFYRNVYDKVNADCNLMQGRNTAQEELLAGWCVGDQLPDPRRMELDVRVSGERSDWEFLLLPFPELPESRRRIRRDYGKQQRSHSVAFYIARWRCYALYQ